jgi:thiamine monophosphate synthase
MNSKERIVTLKIKICTELSEVFELVGNWENSIKHLTKGIQISQKAKNLAQSANMNAELEKIQKVTQKYQINLM